MLKMSILSKAIYRFNAITIKMPSTLSQKYDKMILKIFLEPQKTQMPKLTGENKQLDVSCSLFRLCYKATLIKTALYWHKNRLNGIEQRAQKSTYTSMLNSSTITEARICKGEKTVSSISHAGKTGQLYMKECNQNISSHHIQK